MDPVLLSRIQFGFTAGFHFLFPPLTFGLGLLILIFETLWLKRNNELYKRISSFLIKILALIFVMGVASGITLEFSFGTNWSNYSRLVGDIFGAPLAAEAMIAFFLESVFIGILFFGREKVSPKIYWLSALLVFLGSHISGFWIIVANSWMHTPAGFEKVIVNGKISRLVLTDFSAAVFNPSTIYRFIHVVIAGWISGTLFAGAIAAWYLIKQKYAEEAKSLLKVSLGIFIACAFAQFLSGHVHAVQVSHTNPERMAAFEALWETKEGAPMSLIGIPIESERKTYFEIAIPKLLSFLIHFDPNGKVRGLSEFPEDEWPPVLFTYLSYHVMIGLGALFAAIAGIGIILFLTGKLYTARWYLWGLLIAGPLPLVANEFGWIAAEVGRQPWAIYRVLRTAEAASVVVPSWQILASLIAFFAVYAFLFAIFIYLLKSFIQKGFADGKSAY
ncbi:MAG: cytochrome ubiquinol oxidase subunit I [Spirochaetes bacterium]|nr:cytochrome ubiquinol oxidase subunit I [Spirochaetota bacterium]